MSGRPSLSRAALLPKETGVGDGPEAARKPPANWNSGARLNV